MSAATPDRQPDEERLAGIEARAKAATPGPWEAQEEHGRDYTDEGWSHVSVRAGRTEIAVTYPLPTGDVHDEHEADAAHIAGMDPDTTLWLVARLRESQAEVERLREERDEAESQEGFAVAAAEDFEAELDTALSRAESAERETARLRAQVEAVRARLRHGGPLVPPGEILTLLADVSTADGTDTDATPAADTDEAGERA